MIVAPRAYYNEIDPYAAQWLRNLIAAGHITAGEVDERSIIDVRPADLVGFHRCHFFAGIGVWDYALNRAGWSDSPVWTGSCPCQPFSLAGRGLGMRDERHLWPVWRDLIIDRRPPAVLGEQVASRAVVGGPNPSSEIVWLDAVFADLEAAHYACGAADIPAAGVGAPHIRQRLFFMAHASRERLDGEPAQLRRPGEGGWHAADNAQAAGGGAAGGAMADVFGAGLEGRDARPLGDQCPTAQRGGSAGALADSARFGRDQGRRPVEERAGLGHNSRNSFWSECDWIPCRDGKARPVEPGTFPLAHGATSRVGRLRGYGNAINAEAAIAFIECAMQVRP